jgi:hypothetical protein
MVTDLCGQRGCNLLKHMMTGNHQFRNCLCACKENFEAKEAVLGNFLRDRLNSQNLQNLFLQPKGNGCRYSRRTGIPALHRFETHPPWICISLQSNIVRRPPKKSRFMLRYEASKLHCHFVSEIFQPEHVGQWARISTHTTRPVHPDIDFRGIIPLKSISLHKSIHTSSECGCRSPITKNEKNLSRKSAEIICIIMWKD